MEGEALGVGVAEEAQIPFSRGTSTPDFEITYYAMAYSIQQFTTIVYFFVYKPIIFINI